MQDQVIILTACLPGEPLPPHRPHLLKQHQHLENKCWNTCTYGGHSTAKPEPAFYRHLSHSTDWPPSWHLHSQLPHLLDVAPLALLSQSPSPYSLTSSLAFEFLLRQHFLCKRLLIFPIPAAFGFVTLLEARGFLPEHLHLSLPPSLRGLKERTLLLWSPVNISKVEKLYISPWWHIFRSLRTRSSSAPCDQGIGRFYRPRTDNHNSRWRYGAGCVCYQTRWLPLQHLGLSLPEVVWRTMLKA